ncbi:hypothetical protein K439DRAFT_1547308 [Ramaria rubella]|nr:hypothetical protein K439DRAFT_1547308 [Ramaria rubella]
MASCWSSLTHYMQIYGNAYNLNVNRLDHDGIIVAQLMTGSLKFKNGADCNGPLKSLEESSRELSAVVWGHELIKWKRKEKGLTRKSSRNLPRRSTPLCVMYGRKLDMIFDIGLNNVFDPILNIILALRALVQIITADPGILCSADVQKAIEMHLLGSSPQVRDPAVGLGKYVVSILEIAGDYYEQIGEQIAVHYFIISASTYPKDFCRCLRTPA